jgi:hypothetical protein
MPTDIQDLAEGFSPFAPSPPPAEQAHKPARKKREPNKVKPESVLAKVVARTPQKRASRGNGGTGKGTKHRQSRELRLPVSALFDAASGLKVEDGKLCYAMIEQLQGVSKQSRRRIVNALNRIFS